MIDITLSEAQATALLTHTRSGAPPPDLTDGRTLAALQRAADRLEAALYRRPIPDYIHTCDQLCDTLHHIRSRPLIDLIHARLSDLHAIARLWRAAERLPAEDRFRGLLDPALIDSIAWAADILDALDAAGLDLP